MDETESVKDGSQTGVRRATYSATFTWGEIFPASKNPLKYRQAEHAELEE